MPLFSATSKARLVTCDPRLRVVMNRVIQFVDITVLQGHRSIEEQMKLYRQGRSDPGQIVTMLNGVTAKSKHNYLPSKAIDIAPYPINWDDREKFVYVAGIVLGIAYEKGIDLRWGGDWDEDNDLKDHNSPMDLPHFEVKD